MAPYHSRASIQSNTFLIGMLCFMCCVCVDCVAEFGGGAVFLQSGTQYGNPTLHSVTFVFNSNTFTSNTGSASTYRYLLVLSVMGDVSLHASV